MARELPKTYDPKQVEHRIYSFWQDNGFFKTKRDPDKKYVKCPKCKSTLRVPRQKGKHTVRCPRCDHRFQIRIIRGAKAKSDK